MKIEEPQFRPVWLCGNCLTEQENCFGPVAICLTDEIPLGLCAICNAPACHHVRILKTDEERARDTKERELNDVAGRVVDVWNRHLGRVFESMGRDNPRAEAIDKAVNLLQTAIKS